MPTRKSHGAEDAFPGHSRTCDALLEYTFDERFKPGGEEDELNYASLLLPVFEFSAMDIHFSVTCDGQLAYGVEVALEQFDRSVLLSGDEAAKTRLCPGQDTFAAFACILASYFSSFFCLMMKISLARFRVLSIFRINFFSSFSSMAMRFDSRFASRFTILRALFILSN